jgi:hypothetical protein
MALDSKNNIKSVFIVPQRSTTTVTKMLPGADPGAVAVCDLNNDVLVSISAANQTIKIIKDRGANLPLQQVRLNLADLAAYSGAAYAPASEQFSFIGYNGVSGSITGFTGNLVNTFYIVKLEHVPNAFAYGKRPANYKYGTYQSLPTGATQAQIANGLQASLVQNFVPNRTIDWRVVTEIVCDVVAGSAPIIAGGVTSLGVTRYSRTVTLNGAVSNVAPGDFIRLGGTTTSTPVYKVAVVTSPNTITLEVPYQGVTGTIAVANTGRILAASAATANFGLKITGLKQKYDVNRWRQYDKVRFNALLENFGSGTTVTNTAAFDGLGVYEQVANDEYISWGDEGQIFVDQVPPQFREQDAQIGGEYSPLVLGWVNNLPSLIGAGENKGQAILYMDAYVSNPGDQATDIATLLDTWAAIKGFANQEGNLV